MNAETAKLANELMQWFQVRKINPNDAVNIMVRVLAVAVLACSGSEDNATDNAVRVGDMLSHELNTWFHDRLFRLRALDDIPTEGNA